MGNMSFEADLNALLLAIKLWPKFDRNLCMENAEDMLAIQRERKENRKKRKQKILRLKMKMNELIKTHVGTRGGGNPAPPGPGREGGAGGARASPGRLGTAGAGRPVEGGAGGAREAPIGAGV